jgi:DNA-binding SARP family transcriptional activator
MDTYYLSTQYLQANKSEVVGSMYMLIQRSLNLLLHGNNAEGISLLAQAHAHLTAESSQLVNLLEDAINTCMRYNLAQEALLNASMDYAKAEAERQVQLSILADMLATQYEENMVAPLTFVPLHGYLAHQREEQKSSPSNGKIGSTPSLSSSMTETHSERLPALYITCFGRFTVWRGSEPLMLCQNRNGQAILRYLVAQANHRATIDVLMTTFWPDDEPEKARRKLQVAVSALRHTLNQGYDCDTGGGYILCKEQYYQINSSVTITSDVEEFLAHYKQGQRSGGQSAIRYYEQACRLYIGTYLVEDIYADWSCKLREQCSLAHATMCNVLAEHALSAENYDDAIHWANLVLAENRCDEAVYCLLMQVYATLGRRSEVIRQYQRCEQVLNEELGVAPMPETTQLFHSLLATYTYGSEHRAFLEQK